MDSSDRAEQLFTEIALGVPKAKSRNILDEADAELWDKIAANIAAMPKGKMIEYDISASKDLSEYENHDSPDA
jgi:hypothetical protein